MTRILFTRQFRDEFGNCLRLKPTEVKIVVPYFGTTPFGNIVEFSRHLRQKRREFHLVTSPPGKNNNGISWDDAQHLAEMGVGLTILTKPRLHAKIYQFCFSSGRRLGFIGSANFSAGGFENNHEVVAFFDSKEDNDRIQTEIDRVLNYGDAYNRYLARRRMND